ncbi:MAG: DUF692 family protein [Planctomycetes bacterium]|nr:DUF692 family protein [Planctomycetota bacterium]
MANSPFDRCVAAPPMGIGLGVDVFDDQPDWQVLIESFREGFDFLELYSRGDADHCEFLREFPAEIPRTYHHEGLDPVGPKLCDLKSIDDCQLQIERLSPPWVVEELAVRHIDGFYTDFFFPAVLIEDSVKTSIANLKTIQARLSAPLLPENPPYEFHVGDMHLFDFLNQVSHGAEMGIVLDLGHVWSYQLCIGKGDTPCDNLDTLDLSRVIEIHLAGARVEAVKGKNAKRAGIYRDLHGAGPIPEESFELLEAVLPKASNLRAITVEVETSTEENAVKQVDQVRKAVERIAPEYFNRVAAAAGR